MIYNINESYFRDIDDNHKAYWLGFIAADGNIYKHRLGIELQQRDEDHLKNFLKDIESERPLYYRERNNCKSVSLYINNEIFTDNLIAQGIIPRKTSILKFPDNLDEKYYGDFIRGFFDGDGCYVFTNKIRWRKDRNKYCNRKNVEISCVCKSKDFVYTIHEVLTKNGCNSKLEYSKRDLYYIRIHNKFEMNNFINYIYYDDCLMLERKRAKMLEIKEYCLS